MTIDSKERCFFGVITNVQEIRGYFFIRVVSDPMPDHPRDVFAHVSQVLPGSVTPEVGNRATFAISTDVRRGKAQAIGVLIFPKDLWE